MFNQKFVNENFRKIEYSLFFLGFIMFVGFILNNDLIANIAATLVALIGIATIIIINKDLISEVYQSSVGSTQETKE